MQRSRGRFGLPNTSWRTCCVPARWRQGFAMRTSTRMASMWPAIAKSWAHWLDGSFRSGPNHLGIYDSRLGCILPPSGTCRSLPSPARTTRVKPYSILQRAAMYEPAHGTDLKATLPLALVAQQLHPNPQRFGAWLADGLRRTSDETLQADVLRTLTLNRPDLVMAALNGRRAWTSAEVRPTIGNRNQPARCLSPSGGANSRTVTPLLHLMLEPDNVFGQENSVLLLAAALLRHPGIEDRLATGCRWNVLLRCEDWSRIPALPLSDGFLSPLTHSNPVS